jgi:hypothetical protein
MHCQQLHRLQKVYKPEKWSNINQVSLSHGEGESWSALAWMMIDVNWELI